jgi:hypothetical protein
MIATEPNPQISRSSPPVIAGEPLDAAAFARLRQRMILDGCKWDPQVGDMGTLAPFPLIMKAAAWREIAGLAELLSVEALAAEEEILRRPELLPELGFPARLVEVLLDETPLTPTPGRIMRFDFHLTTYGWRISEVNSDVPGGFSEGSLLPALMAEQFPHLRPAGDPADAWTSALAASAGPGGRIALLSAPGYMEDHQVISFLAAKLHEHGCLALLAKPEQVSWDDGRAHLATSGRPLPLDVVVKFYQAEWLSRLSHKLSWKFFFRGGKTPVANSALAVISESKRFPLVWDRLSTPLPTWRALLPETRPLRSAPWSTGEGWLLKTAMCNNGDTVRSRSSVSPRDWLWTRLDAALRPGQWLAQRRFESVPLATPVGPRHTCIGVFTVNCKTAGSYIRMSPRPLIDYAAVDAAMLLDDDD